MSYDLTILHDLCLFNNALMPRVISLEFLLDSYKYICIPKEKQCYYGAECINLKQKIIKIPHLGFLGHVPCLVDYFSF